MARRPAGVERQGPYVIVEGEVDGTKCCWVERGGVRVSGYCGLDDAREHASLLYDEYLLDADVSMGD
ncbi:MAG TPA: hypothetical protein VF816_06990 [Rhodocyclaceae bacterium]